MATRLLSDSVFVYKGLIVSVSRQRQCDSELSCSIGLNLVEKICHLQGIKVGRTASNPIPSIADCHIATQILCLIVIVKVLLWRARRLLHTLVPHPHQRVLRNGARLGFSDNLYRIDAVTK